MAKSRKIPKGQSESVYHIEEEQTTQWPKVGRYQRGNQNAYIEEEQTTQWPKVGRYQRGNQNAYIEEEQTTQWPKVGEDTKGVIRIRISKNR